MKRATKKVLDLFVVVLQRNNFQLPPLTSHSQTSTARPRQLTFNQYNTFSNTRLVAVISSPSAVLNSYPLSHPTFFRSDEFLRNPSCICCYTSRLLSKLISTSIYTHDLIRCRWELRMELLTILRLSHPRLPSPLRLSVLPWANLNDLR